MCPAGGEVILRCRSVCQNPNPEVEGYSYVNLSMLKTLGTGAADPAQTRPTFHTDPKIWLS